MMKELLTMGENPAVPGTLSDRGLGAADSASEPRPQLACFSLIPDIGGDSAPLSDRAGPGHGSRVMERLEVANRPLSVLCTQMNKHTAAAKAPPPPPPAGGTVQVVRLVLKWHGGAAR
jgi:hypothetical protein